MRTQNQEMHFAPLPRYSGTKSPTSTPKSEVEAWLDRFPEKRAENRPNGGIVLSAPSVGKSEFRDLRGAELREAKAKARREHKAALKAQQEKDAQCAKEIAKQLIEWRKEQQEAKKEAEKQKAAEALKAKTSRKKGRIEQKAGKAIMAALLTGKNYYLKDSKYSDSTIRKVVSEARALGYKIKPIQIKSTKQITGYKLTGIKKP